MYLPGTSSFSTTSCALGLDDANFEDIDWYPAHPVLDCARTASTTAADVSTAMYTMNFNPLVLNTPLKRT